MLACRQLLNLPSAHPDPEITQHLPARSCPRPGAGQDVSLVGEGQSWQTTSRAAVQDPKTHKSLFCSHRHAF